MYVMTPSQTALVSGGNDALLKLAAFIWNNRDTLANIASEAALEMADLDAECGAN